MLIIHATDTLTSKQVDVHHEVKNAGNPKEEHHFSIFTKRTVGEPAGKLLLHYVLSTEAAAELKRHL